MNGNYYTSWRIIESPKYITSAKHEWYIWWLNYESWGIIISIHTWVAWCWFLLYMSKTIRETYAKNPLYYVWYNLHYTTWWSIGLYFCHWLIQSNLDKWNLHKWKNLFNWNFFLWRSIFTYPGSTVHTEKTPRLCCQSQIQTNLWYLWNSFLYNIPVDVP